MMLFPCYHVVMNWIFPFEISLCWSLMCLTWKILITLGRNVDRKGVPPKIIFISVLINELWHICKSLLPSAKGQSIYFHVIYYSCWVNFLFQPQSISWQTSCGGERSKHIYLVKYIWWWLIIVDNYLYDKWVGRRNIKPLSFSLLKWIPFHLKICFEY